MLNKYDRAGKTAIIAEIVISFILNIFLNAGISLSNCQTIFCKVSFMRILLFFCSWIMIEVAIIILDYMFSGIISNISNTVNAFSDLKVFILVFTLLIVLWMPYLIVLYPGSMWYDCASSILQMYGIKKLENWNPILQTILIGGSIRIGDWIGNVNLGIFLYNCFQMLLASSVIAYMLLLLYRPNKNEKIIWFGILIYGLLPVYPIYITALGKDTNWSCFLLLSLACLWNEKNRPNWIKKPKNILFCILALLGVCLLRNAGIYVAICFCFVLLVIVPSQIRIRTFFGECVFIVTILFWSNCMLPALGVSIDNISRDSWNIQFQQIARFVTLYPDEVTETDKETINLMLSYENMSTKYNPNIVDPIINGIYHGDTISEGNKRRFMKMYWNMFRRHPLCFIDAICAKCWGYFTPMKWESVKPFTVIGVHDVYISVKDALPDLQFYNIFDLSAYGLFVDLLQKTPIINLVTRCGMWVWQLFFVLLVALKKRRYDFCLYSFPFFMIVVGLIIVPANNYFRYILSLVFALPFFILGIYGTRRLENGEEQ